MTPKKDFLSIDDLGGDELAELLDRAAKIKEDPAKGADGLEGRHVALIFEKPSTRTRVSFEVGVAQLGGTPLVLRGDELQLGRGETIEDTARVFSRYVNAVVLRTFGHDRVERLAAAADIPVVNALSDLSHPCQALADLQTIREQKGSLSGLSIAYLGDGNNVAHSLMQAGALSGMHVRVACPQGYEPDKRITRDSQEAAARAGGSVVVTNVVAEAVTGADVLYTDVWTSMGQEEEAAARLERMKPYQLNVEALRLAADDAIVMHCLPAHRGEEITADVMDGPRSVVFDQAENRLHSQKALLLWLLR